MEKLSLSEKKLKEKEKIEERGKRGKKDKKRGIKMDEGRNIWEKEVLN